MFMRPLSCLLVASLLVTTPAAAADCQADVAALRALYELRHELLRPYSNTYGASQRVDAHIDRLREPLPGGGYRWVQWVRPSDDPPVSKHEHLIASGFDTGAFDEFEASGAHPFGIRVAVPRKRSLTKANKEAYVGRVEIRYWVDGRQRTMSKDINSWLSPGTMKGIDLGVIAERAEVTIETAARNASKREALVEIHFKQAVAQDNPENPGYEAIQSLRRVQSNLTPVALDYEIARFERRLFPELTSTPYTTLIMKVREAEKLLRSEKSEDQEKGKRMLSEVSRNVQ